MTGDRRMLARETGPVGPEFRGFCSKIRTPVSAA